MEPDRTPATRLLLGAEHPVDLGAAHRARTLSGAAAVGHLDLLALCFTGAVSLLTGVGFGIFPALRASDPAVHMLLKDVRSTTSHARLRGASPPPR